MRIISYFSAVLCFALSVSIDLCSAERENRVIREDFFTSKNAIVLEKMCKGYDKKFPEIKHVSVKNFLESPDKWVLVDVRPLNEREISMISGALTSEQIEQNPNLYKQKKLLIYCTVGERSSKYAIQLLSKGFKNVTNLRGGVLKWAESGRKFVTPEGKKTTKVHVYGKKWNLLPDGYTGVW